MIAGNGACRQREAAVGDQPAQLSAGAPISETPGRGTTAKGTARRKSRQRRQRCSSATISPPASQTN